MVALAVAIAASPSAAQTVPTASGAGDGGLRDLGASLVLPGLGQRLRGEARGWVYLAAEAGLWIVWVDQRGDARADRRAYRDLAWAVARGGPTPRVDGDFGYYERLTRWTRSGAFDRTPGVPGLQPETDPATFNGDAWRLARSLFWNGADTPPDPAAETAALDFYRDRAYEDDLRWDWGGVSEAQARFRRLIRSSDDAFGRARLAVGGLVANRFLSVVDVWISSRAPGATRIRMLPGRSGPAVIPQLVVSWSRGGVE